MKIRGSLKKLWVIIIILSILFSMPVLAVETVDTKSIVLEYEDIESLVLQENLQLKSGKASIDRLNHKIDDTEDDAEEAEDSLYGLIYSINGVMDILDSIIDKYDPADPSTVDPDVVAIAQAVNFSLSITQETLHAQIEGLEDITDDMSDQLDLFEVSYEQAKKTFISTTKNLFILYHQLTNNIKQLEVTRIQLSDQLETINKNIELGLAARISAIDLQTAIFELDASRTALIHQQGFLMLQMKSLLGLTYKDGLTLGELPNIDLSVIDSIEFYTDIENAIENAISIKVKEAELQNASITGNRKKYELQIKEHELVLNFTKKYYSLLEARDNLQVSENKLSASKLKLEQGQNNFDKGLISRTELSSLKNDFEILELKVKSDSALLFIEIENYIAMKTGLL